MISPQFLKPRGMTLVVAMIVLAMLSVMGIYAVNSAVMENRIAGNYRGAQEALMWADAGIDFARSYIAGAPSHPVTFGGEFCTGGAGNQFLYYPSDVSPKVRICIWRLKEDNVAASGSAATSGGQAVYGKVQYYRIRSIAPYLNDGGVEIGHREIESVERIFQLSR